MLGLELLLHQHTERSAVPVIRDEQIMGHPDAMKARAEPVEKFVDGGRLPCSLTGDGLNHGQKIFRTVRQLTQQQAKLLLAVGALDVELLLSLGEFLRAPLEVCFQPHTRGLARALRLARLEEEIQQPADQE